MKLLEILNCPFCGQPAKIWEASWTGAPSVGCTNDNCIVKPYITWNTDKIAKKANTIVNSKHCKTQYEAEIELKNAVIQLWNERH